jgi:tripartite-type tricarboxylate transporter receptor subunit TctC
MSAHGTLTDCEVETFCADDCTAEMRAVDRRKAPAAEQQLRAGARFWCFVCAACCAVAFARAESGYPDHALRLIVPFTPGGATDMLARLVGERLTERLGQPVVIDNRPGASGNLGAAIVANAGPDGYTLLMAPTSIYAISATLYAQLNYDLLRSFAPVSLVANVPHVLVATPDLPVRSVQELIALAKQQPGKMNLANQGSGTVSHLEGELFKHMAGVEMLNIPYKGSAPAMLDLTTGRVQVMFDSIASALPHIRSGRLRALGVTATARSPLLPQVPTLDEAGLKGYSAESLLGILAPAATRRAVIDRLNRELVALLQEPATRERLAAAGFEPVSSSSEEFSRRIRADLLKWAPIVKSSGATVE